MGNQVGGVVAIDPRTGAVLAMVGNPAYDPNAVSYTHLDVYKRQFPYKILCPSYPNTSFENIR